MKKLKCNKKEKSNLKSSYRKRLKLTKKNQKSYRKVKKKDQKYIIL